MNFIKQTADHVILVVQICKNSLVTFLLKLEIPVGWSCSTPSTPRRLWRGGVFTPIGFEIAGGLEKHVWWANDWVKGPKLLINEKSGFK